MASRKRRIGTSTFQAASFLVLGLLFQGCISWTGRGWDDVARADRVRIETQGGDRIEVMNPQLEGDSVLVGLGVSLSGYSREQGARPIRIPVTEVLTVKTRGVSAPATFTVLGLFGVLAFFLSLPFWVPST